ncbi:MAG TPA: Clp protease N-terminal domain-containing protein [Acidimicrobiales bacterium]
MTPGPTLQELIDGVRADTPGEDALVQLSQASKTVADLEQTSDALLGHFVDQCRRSGRSWSDISGALGVSKQAAHKRFSLDAPNFERFTDRARNVLAQSEEEAHRLGHGFVGTEHLLLALFDSPDGLAAKILDESGITRSMVETQIVALIKPGTGSEERKLPFTPRAKAVVRNALHEALQLGHNYVGTEHLLLGLFTDGESVAAKVLVELGASLDGTRAKILKGE